MKGDIGSLDPDFQEEGVEDKGELIQVEDVDTSYPEGGVNQSCPGKGEWEDSGRPEVKLKGAQLNQY